MHINSSILAGWHAAPLTRTQAQKLLRDVQSRRKRAMLHAEDCCMCQTEEFAAHFWLNQSLQKSFGMAVQTEVGQARVALLLLTYGQLLVASKLNIAFEYLDKGLLQAANLLSPTDYFKVLNRHELLSVLPLFPEARPPADLVSLENEARILLRLKKGQPHLTRNFVLKPQR